MENIVKQGYLKKAKPIAADSPRSSLCSSLLQLFESSRWYMFIVRNGRPYLEIFEKEQNAFSGQPSTSYELSSCYKITYTLGRTSKAWTFCLFLEERVLEITADSREQMLDWCRNLERTLVHYGKIKQNTEHVYVEYPVRYTPKKTGLEQEAMFEAGASVSASAPAPHIFQNHTVIPEPSQEDYQDFIDLIDHIDDDDEEEEVDGEETNSKTDLSGAFAGPQSPEIPTKPKKYARSPLQGAEGGSSVTADKDSDNDVDTSEDDFVTKDFWLSNKLPSVPQRSDSQKFRTSGRPFSEFDMDRVNAMSRSVPPLPARGTSLIEKGPTFIRPINCNSDPKPPPRRKCSINLLEGGLKKTSSKSVSEDNVSVRSPLVTSNADDIEDLDDGYDNVVELRKSNSDSAATDPWVRSLENNDVNSRKSTLKAYDDAQLFVRLPDARVEKSDDYYNFNTPTPEDSFNFNWTQKSVKHSSSSDEEGVHATGNKLELDSAAAAVKQMTLGGKDENYNLCDTKVHGQNVVPDKEIASNIYDFGKSFLVKEPINVRAENIYDFARSEGTLVHTQIPPSSQLSLPQGSNMVIHPATFATSGPSDFGELDSLYSIPKSAKPVAGLSTEEVLRPGRPPWRVTPEPAPTLYSVPQKRTSKSHSNSSMADVEPPKALYSVPQKKASKSHSSSSMEESCENSKSSTTPKTKSMDSFLAPKPPSLDTLPNKKPPSLEKLCCPAAPSLDSLPSQTQTSVTSPVRRSPISMRPLPSLPTDFDCSSEKQNLLSSTKSERATSPSHDGFTFNFLPDAETNSKSSTTSSSGSGASKEEDTEPVYEDATGRNSNPPLPPKRSIRRNTNRSVSVYIPGKTGGTLTTRLDPAPSRAESLDDQAISRPQVGRQVSLTERQQIRQSAASIVVIPLKQSQVDLLNEEQKEHGVGLDVSPKSANAVALVEMYNGVWIAGWDGRRCPRLAEKIHIGDQLLSVEDVRVTSSSHASKLLKQTQSKRVTLVVKRLPYATILAIRRNHDGENLGITREGGTAEITYVDPNGLVARCGLQKRAKSVEGTGECNWMLTEINCRSLNFSYKGEEIERLLNAVGRDISIVIQPADFVRQIKKQLKKLKNYKDYLC
ncbi:uncharacterized protein LOC110462324 [Mizuhopecten yessoensis]|uniref:PH domain-containing protein n=1 Tax=Mizuhopecten yessoensis TaxID=6573 RepID=A0A210PYA8_MIZYE|nr:uncharacterized protein LOC110462324 [Mizuhopecten yessoensis]XP_021371928.1 uncharacterized protein LOC110462324 [Mizuhopecten yessoensis]OWF41462.1 hypothetical protein KP79_PYT17353 [Mizuhopecten yessoensis]